MSEQIGDKFGRPSSELLNLRGSTGGCVQVRAWGSKGAACVLLHGLGDGGFIWDGVARALASRFRVLVIDLRGHGGSSWDEEGRYAVSHHVNDVLEVLASLNLEQYILIGHSMGGEVAARVADRRPRQVSALLLLDAGPTEQPAKSSLIRSYLLEGHRHYRSKEDYVAWLQQKFSLADADVLRQVADGALKPAGDGFVPVFDPRVTDVLLEPSDGGWWFQALKRIRRPTLVVRGVASALLSRLTAQQMSELLPRGSLATVGRAGHALVIENPDGLLKAAWPFLVDIACLAEASAGLGR